MTLTKERRLRIRANKERRLMHLGTTPLDPRIPLRAMYYGRDGWPISQRTWARRISDRAYKVVDSTYCCNGRVWVSTVWLGLDHGFGRPQKPLIFETMAFARRGEEIDFRDGLHQDRYATLAQARRGHAAMVAQVEADYFRRQQHAS